MIILLVMNSLISFIVLFYILTYYLQLNRYEICQTIKVCGKSCVNVIGCQLLLDVIYLVCNFLFQKYTSCLIIGLLIIGLKLTISCIYFHKHFVKNRLVFTKRVVRLLVICVVVFCLIMMLLSRLQIANIVTMFFVIAYIISYLLSKLVEYFIHKKYIYATKQKLKKYPNVKVIGVTGSYGKTTTKEFITQILKSKYIVKCTPKSYNTPMGISKFILDTDLRNVDILVIEMGAVRVGDIRVLCDIVHPCVGVITSIGKQHLDTFKSMDNIIKTKLELFDHIIKNNGHIIYMINPYFDIINYNNKSIICVNNAVNNDNKVACGDNYCIYNKFLFNIMKYDKNGANLQYLDIYNKIVGYLSTMLIGYGYIVDICLAVSVGVYFGIDFSDISKVVNNLGYIDNRLELKQGRNGASVIFDAYNSNENSFIEMINVSKMFDAKYKILITPGIVELGKQQYQINKKLSSIASGVFDEIWIINKVNKYAFIDGVKDNTKCKLIEYDKLDKIIFDKVNSFGKDFFVVFENDLPDSYV